jgi:hypothetical protein
MGPGGRRRVAIPALTLLAPVIVLYLWRKAKWSDLCLAVARRCCRLRFQCPASALPRFTCVGRKGFVLDDARGRLTVGARTPLVPYPNGIYYPLNLLNHWGIVVSALTLFGLGAAFVRDRGRPSPCC